MLYCMAVLVYDDEVHDACHIVRNFLHAGPASCNALRTTVGSPDAYLALSGMTDFMFV